MIRTLMLLSPLGLAALVLCAGAADARDPARTDTRKETEKLEKLRDTLEKVDTSLKWLSRALWAGSVATGNPDLKKGKEFVDKLRGPASDLKRGVDGLIEIKEADKARKEASKLVDTTSCRDLKSCRPVLEKLAEQVRAVPVGLVSDRVDPGFAVSGEMLARDPQEARRRFRAYAGAMDANIRYLRDTKATLEEMRLRARAASEVLRRLAEACEKAARTGLYTREMVLQFLELDRLQGICNGIAADCETKLREVDRARDTEQRRLDNLKSIVKTLFGFDL